MKILLSFIGNNDCYLNEGKKGALISILENEDYDKVYILYNDDKYLKYASNILLYCNKNIKNLKVSYSPTLTINPIDYNLVYPAMYNTVKKIVKENPNADFTISLTSGTSTMHSCWIFLREGGVIDARLIQTSLELGISKIDLKLDDFPQINDIKQIKVELTKLSRENKSLKNKFKLNYDNIIGKSKQITNTKEQINLLSKYDLSVFITGESGTGKELVAEALHFNSDRKKNPFIKVNCGAISTNLFESEFFGHKKGAFTGANFDRIGKFKEANEGTIFLDEIGDLTLEMQVKLLRVLNDGTFTPIGANKEEKTDVRVLSATNKNIGELIKTGKFREDLYYRIANDIIDLSPLRHRKEDINLLVEYFLGKLNYKYKKKIIISESAMNKLILSDWQGNIRELKAVIERAYIYVDKEIEPSNIKLIDLNTKENIFFIPNDGIDFDNEITPRYYLEALKKSDGNIKKASEFLKIPEKTFYHRLKSKNISYKK